MLKLTVAEVAQMAGVSPNTVVRVEADKSVNTATLHVLRAALEAAGATFLSEDNGGPGVRLRSPEKLSGTGGKGNKTDLRARRSPAPAKPGPRRSMPAALSETGLSSSA